MEISIFLARLLGPYYVIVAIGILFNLKIYQKVMEDFFKNAALIYLGGIIAFLFGLVIVLVHNVWQFDWAVIITIFGWLGIIKGAWLIILPDSAAKLTQAYQKNISLLVVPLFIVLALGAFLLFMGYFVL